MLTIDASVWVAADTADEAAHDDCAAFLRAVVLAGLQVHLPTLCLVEVTAAVARRTRDATLARAIGLALLEVPGVVFHGLDLERATRAAVLAGVSFLRGADGVYAAIAAEKHTTLITLDDELLARAPDGLAVMTPAAWLSRTA